LLLPFLSNHQPLMTHIDALPNTTIKAETNTKTTTNPQLIP
jgi:hypothetical protein